MSTINNVTMSTTAQFTDLNLTCSTGSSTITYTLANYKTQSVPSWVSIDSATGVMNVTAPKVLQDVEYIFKIVSVVNSSTIEYSELMHLTIVSTCSVQYCDICVSGDPSTCNT